MVSFDLSDSKSFDEVLSLFQRRVPKMDKSKLRVVAPNVADGSSVDEKRDLFEVAVERLASLEVDLNDAEINDFVIFFTRLYDESDEKFRHMYSHVCSILFGFLADDGRLDDGVPPQAVKLANNVALILGEIKRLHPESRAACCVLKLYDHIELENKRMRYMTLQNKAHGEEEAKIAKKLKKCEVNLADIEKKNKSLKSDLEKTQREYVAILGIFAAVVVAFSGGVNFSITSISASQGYNIVHMAFIVSVVGAFVFNLLYALFTFVFRMVRHNGDNWGILGKDAFIKINKNIVFIVAFFFFASMLMTFVEHAWSL